MIIATEKELAAGIGWALAVCLLGCPNACFWAALQLYRRGTLSLAAGRDATTAADALRDPWPASRTVGVGFFPLYGVGFVVLLVVRAAVGLLVG